MREGRKRVWQAGRAQERGEGEERVGGTREEYGREQRGRER